MNDVSLRNLIPDELAKGFGFLQSKPRSALSPVFVTPDELGAAFAAGKLSEAFACGTAAVITPIRELVHRGQVIYRNDGSARFTDVTAERLPDELVRFSWDLELVDVDNDFALTYVVTKADVVVIVPLPAPEARMYGGALGMVKPSCQRSA